MIDFSTLDAGRALYVVGDVRDCLAATPDGSVDLVMTSPPFLALRSYLPADHPDKWREIGAEPDPASFIDTLLGLTAEFRRVLAPHGSIVVELGDTYSGTDGAGSWPLPKSMVGIPHLYHLSLAYGRNLLTGEPSPAGQWRIRNVVAWCRPNPPVGALGDKFRPATSYLTIATVASDRFFDLDAVRGALSRRRADTSDPRNEPNKQREGTNFNTLGAYDPAQSGGAPPLDWWEIPTQPYSGSHYAVYPPALLERPIKSMVPPKVCRTCGKPSERIVETSYVEDKSGGGSGHTDNGTGEAGTRRIPTRLAKQNDTLGWTDCECSDDGSHWRPGVVLDPFAGSGTTLMVATGHGHAAVGFDIDERNATLASERVGPMLLETATLDEKTREQG